VNEAALGTDSFSVQIEFAFWLFRNWSNDIWYLMLHSVSPLFFVLFLRILWEGKQHFVFPSLREEISTGEVNFQGGYTASSCAP